MNIGKVPLPSPFAVAPMAGMTDTAFRRLSENPGIAQHAAAHQHAANAGLKTLHEVFGLDAVAAAKHRDRQVAGDPRNELPVGESRVTLRGRPSVDRDR